MQTILKRFALSLMLCTLFASDLPGQSNRSSDETDIEIDIERCASVTPEIKKDIQDWIIDLESTPLLVDRLAVVVTGEYFTGGKVQQTEMVDAKRFAICWAMHHGGEKQRVLFTDESLLKPIVLDGNGGRFMRSTANQWDQLKVADGFHEAIGNRVYPVRKESRLTMALKGSGLFFPLTAATATVNEMYRGSAMEPTAARVDMKHLTAAYRDSLPNGKSHTVAEFVYQSSDRIVLHRFVVFQDQVPIQVEDRIASANGEKYRVVSLLNPQPDDWKQINQTRKDAVTYARTRTRWGKIKPDLNVPIELASRTLSGPGAVEMKASFVWLVNQEVNESIFDPATVGSTAPLELIE